MKLLNSELSGVQLEGTMGIFCALVLTTLQTRQVLEAEVVVVEVGGGWGIFV